MNTNNKRTDPREQHERGTTAEMMSALYGESDLLARFCESVSANVVGEEQVLRLLYLAFTSRLLDEPISVLIKGASSGGKNYLLRNVMAYFPQSAYYYATSGSSKALLYKKPDTLVHRILVLAEAVGGENFEYTMRSLLSEGVLCHATVDRVRENGPMQGRELRLYGPTGMISTTTRLNLHDENETRLLSASVNESPEQTMNVLRSIAEHAEAGTMDRRKPRLVGKEPEVQPECCGWHELQTWLEEHGERRIVVPFATTLAELCDGGQLRVRRDFEKVLCLIRTHALLHQGTRKRDAEGRVVAELRDYAAIYDLVENPVGVPERVWRAAQVVVQLCETDTEGVTNKQIAAALGVSDAEASRRLAEAARHGLIKDNGTGQKRAWTPTNEQPKAGTRSLLPTVDALEAAVNQKTGRKPDSE